MSAFQFSSRGSGSNTATMCSIYLYFNTSLNASDIENENLGRQFRVLLTSETQNNVQKRKLRGRYVLARNNLPNPAANVGKCPKKTVIYVIIFDVVQKILANFENDTKLLHQGFALTRCLRVKP